MWFGEDLLWWLAPRPYGYYRGCHGDYGLMGIMDSEEERPKMSFPEAVFSFVFGDGDPNARLVSETRWRLIGEAIAQNGGSVVAEQIAPFLDPPEGSSDEDGVVDTTALDRAMLPVLLRFRGTTEVSAVGDIVYVFPDMQESRAAGQLLFRDLPTTEMKWRLNRFGVGRSAVERPEVVAAYWALERRICIQAGSSPLFLEERDVAFSEASEAQLAGSAGYGAFALLATLYFGSQIASGKVAILARFYPFIGFLSNGYPLLLAYTSAFLGIPLWRWLRLRRVNEDIRKRNSWRSKLSQAVRQPGAALRRKLQNATSRARAPRDFGSAIYDSSATTADTQRRSEADALKAFDERLGASS